MKILSFRWDDFMNFSVLMSIYYKENPKHFDECLRSVLINQSLKPTEIILVKDGKIGEELENVIEKYQKEFPTILKTLQLEENVGLGNALNFGLNECQYDLVMRMDTDDICEKDRFKKQVDYMTKHPNVSVLGGSIEEFNEDLNEEKRLKSMPLTSEEVKKYAKFRNPLNHMTVCFKKDDIIGAGSYQPLLYLEDYYLWIRVILAGKVIENIPDTLVYARIGNGFEKRRGNKSQIKGWKKLQKIMYKNKMINFFEKTRNIMAIYALVLVPDSFRKKLYDKVLRRGKKNG